ALVEQTPGALGYLETGYAELVHLSMARLQNKSGAYILPSLESGQAALKGVTMPPNFRVWITDPAAADAYPIVTYTWMLCFTDYSDNPQKAAALRDVLRFGLTEGQQFSAQLGYIPLPPDVVSEVMKAIDRIKP